MLVIHFTENRCNPSMASVVGHTVYFRDNDTKKLRARPYLTLQLDRQNGISSAYFACRRSAHDSSASRIWLRITGSPMFDGAGRLQTFGVVELAPPELLRELEAERIAASKE